MTDAPLRRAIREPAAPPTPALPAPEPVHAPVRLEPSFADVVDKVKAEAKCRRRRARHFVEWMGRHLPDTEAHLVVSHVLSSREKRRLHAVFDAVMPDDQLSSLTLVDSAHRALEAFYGRRVGAPVCFRHTMTEEDYCGKVSSVEHRLATKALVG